MSTETDPLAGPLIQARKWASSADNGWAPNPTEDIALYRCDADECGTEFASDDEAVR